MRIQGCKQGNLAKRDIYLATPYSETTKVERKGKMKSFEERMNLGNIDFKGMVIDELPDSLLVIANQKIHILEKRIILMNQVSKQESQFLMSIAETKGGLII